MFRRVFPRFRAEIIIVFSFFLWAALTVGFVSYSISSSQHKFCDLVTTLNNAPAPSPQPGSASNPGRLFDEKIAKDIIVLKGSLGC